MTYSAKIDESKEKVYNHAIATKIRDLMGKLRKSANEDRKRRWIWELLQNAKDAAYDDQDVVVEIDFKNNANSGKLEFKHNGRPFSVDNITFLIEQVSTKDQKTEEGERPKQTGKFGTGFLTTHLLSEVVDIKGIIKEPDLAFRKFNFQLDRSGRELDEIMKNVNDSLSLLNKLDSEPEFNGYQKDDLNTTFTYQLDSKSIEVAKTGLSDLQFSLPFTLVFLPNIKSVTIASECCSYSLLHDATKKLGNIYIQSKKLT